MDVFTSGDMVFCLIQHGACMGQKITAKRYNYLLSSGSTCGNALSITVIPYYFQPISAFTAAYPQQAGLGQITPAPLRSKARFHARGRRVRTRRPLQLR